MSHCCTVGYKLVTVIDDIKFEFNDLSLYTKNDSERTWGLTVYRMFYSINYIFIISKEEIKLLIK